MSRYIDADELKIGLRQGYDSHGLSYEAQVFVDMIDEEPTADVAEVMHGKWKTISTLEDWNDYKCSICGEDSFLEGLEKYCPNCGARMDGGKE